MRKLLILLLLIPTGMAKVDAGILTNAQTAYENFLLEQQVQNAIKGLKQGEEDIALAQMAVQGVRTMGSLMQEAQNDLKNIDNMNFWKLSNVMTIASDIFCFKDNNMFSTQLHFLNIVQLITGAFSNCNQGQVYRLTPSGFTQNWQNQISAQNANLTAYGNQWVNYVNSFNPNWPGNQVKFTWQDHLNAQDSYNAQMDSILQMSTVADNFQRQHELNLAFKYKKISDSLSVIALELNAKVLVTGFQMTKGERVAALKMCQDMQLQSLEYEEKYAKSYQEACKQTETSKAHLSAIKSTQNNLSVVNFIP